MVTVALTADAREQLSELPRPIALRVEKLLERLNNWPHISGVKHLRGDLAGKCRLRTGDYRLQFHVEESAQTVTQTKLIKGKEAQIERKITDYVVVIEKIGHRDGFYED